jgi:hypothetical protein
MLHRLAVGLYSIRTGYFPNLIALYGGLFSKYRNYLGEPENKHLIIQKYKYSLVIENSSDYCSEKLFDAIISGSIPIYIGPKNTEIFLPNNLYYSCDGSVSEIREILSSIRENNVNDMLESMKDFLQSRYFAENWSSDEVYVKIAKKIAFVLCGGDLSGTQQVSEQYLLDVEREAFLSLCGEQKTQERIQYMLQNNKPLRN